MTEPTQKPSTQPSTTKRLKHNRWKPYHKCDECGAPAQLQCRDKDDEVCEFVCLGRTRSIVRGPRSVAPVVLPGESLPELRLAWAEANARRVHAEAHVRNLKRKEAAARARLDDAIEQQKR